MFVSTPEGEHAAPIKRAIELGTVLVEMPITLVLMTPKTFSPR